MIRHLIWDLDGTLVDTYPAFVAAFLATMAEFGHAPDPDQVRDLTLVNLDHCIQCLAKRYNVSEEEIESGFSRHYALTSALDQPLMAGARELCRYITRNRGKNVIVTHRHRKSTEALLAAHEIRPLFSDIISGDDGYPRKPDPSSFLAILARNQIIPAQTLAVGDRSLDIEAGRAAGVWTCLLGGLTDGVRPDYRVKQLEEIVVLLQS